MLLDGGRPVNVWVQHPPQAAPVATLDRVQHIAHCGHLLSHTETLDPAAVAAGASTAQLDHITPAHPRSTSTRSEIGVA
jgi:hypothetical protein